MVLIRPYWFDMYQFGDLYRFSFLADYKDTTRHSQPPPPKKKSGSLDVFMMGDSFGGPFSIANFPSVRNYSFANWNHVEQSDIHLKLDSNAYNVLILETAEKHILTRFLDGVNRKFYVPVQSLENPSDTVGFEYRPKKESLVEKIEKYTSRPAVTNQNISILFFSNPLVLGIKETKAAFNLKVFGKMAEEVEIHPTKNLLVQTMTTDTKYLYMSAFRKHPDSDLDKVENHLNRLNDYYRSKGFDTVLLACVPNPITIIDPFYKDRTYNQVLPRLEERVKKMGVVSVYSLFKNYPDFLYRRGDTHWNEKGEYLWQTRMNERLDSLVPKVSY